ncbi:hypothetical protein RJ641_017638, partial [Dillenia turbinata]
MVGLSMKRTSSSPMKMVFRAYDRGGSTEIIEIHTPEQAEERLYSQLRNVSSKKKRVYIGTRQTSVPRSKRPKS